MPLSVTSPHILQVGGTAYDLRHVVAVMDFDEFVVRVSFRSSGRQIEEYFNRAAFEAAYQASLDASLSTGGGGGIGGAGSAGRVAFWSSASSLTSDADFTYANDTLGLKYQQFDANVAAPAWAPGKVFYDRDDHTLAYYNDIDGTRLNIGQEQVVRVYNTSGAPVQNGQVVYISGAQGQRPVIALARSDSKATSEVIGVATHTIGHNQYGYVTTFGIVHDIDTSAIPVGSIAYLSSTTAGGMVANIPPAPARTVKVGIVIQSHPVNGHILVHPDIASSLNDLNDVWYAIALADGHGLIYNAANGRWENKFLRETDIKPVSKTLAYDGNGRLATVTTSLGTKTFTYDGNGRLTGVTGSGQYASKTLGYTGSQLTSVTVA